MDWLRVDAGTPHHPKIGRLARSLQTSRQAALGHLVSLWCWAASSREDGDLSGLLDEDLDDVSGISGLSVSASECGLLDGDAGSRRLHGWTRRQPLVARRTRDAAYSQRRRNDDATTTKRDATASRRASTNKTYKTNKTNKNLSAPAQPSPGPAAISLPLKGGGAYGVTEEQVASWSEAYPGIDVLGELRKMLAWLAANPGRVKTARGMPRFVVAWLGRAEPQTHSSNGTITNKRGRQAGGDQPRECHDARPDGPWAWLEPARDVLHAQTMLGMAEDAATRLGRLYGPVGWYYDCAWDAVKHWRAEVARLTPAEVR